MISINYIGPTHFQIKHWNMLYHVHTCIAIFFHISYNPVSTHSINQNNYYNFVSSKSINFRNSMTDHRPCSKEFSHNFWFHKMLPYSLAEISVSNLYQNWIKTVSKLCLIQSWYSFSVSNLYQKLFYIILIVSNLYQNCIKCVSEVWYNLILSNRYQICIKSDFVTFDSIRTVSNQTLSSFDSIKTVSNQTLSFWTLSNLYQIRLYHFWLSNLYQNCIKLDFIILDSIKSVSNQTLYHFWLSNLYQNCIKLDFAFLTQW